MVSNVDDIISRSDAGALIPEDAAREILQQATTFSAALTLFPRVTMTRAQRRMPALSAFPVAYWVGGDTGLKQTSEQLWTNRYLDVAEVAVIVPVPQAVLDDADFDIWGEVRPRLAEAIGSKVDAAVFFGSNVPGEWTHAPNGIVPDAITAGHEVGLGDNDDIGLDISAAMEFVESDGFDVTGHVGPRRLRSKLRNARSAGSGEPIYQNIGDGSPGVIYGERYAIASNGAWSGWPTLDLMGDFSQGLFGVRQDINYTVHTEGVISDDDGAIVLNLMQQDAAAIRAVARFAFVVANTITQQKPTDNDATRYPFAVVTTAGS